MDDKDLKITALLERMGEMTAAHEDRVANLRVEITRLTQQVQASEQNIVDAEVVSGE